MEVSPAAATPPDLTVLIVNWNAREPLLRCLASVAAATPGLACEVLVVDNASADGSRRAVARSFPEVRLLASEVNLGFGRGVAFGLRSAAGRYVAVVNPDVELGAGSLAVLAALLDREERAALVGPAIRSPDGQLRSGAERLPGVASAFADVPLLGRLYRATRDRRRHASQRRRCDWVRGPCMLLRRSALEAAGGFPTETFLYGEEMLLGLALRNAGYDTWYEPAAGVEHQAETSSKQRWGSLERAAQVRAARILVMRRRLSRPAFLIWNLLSLAGLSLGVATSSLAGRSLRRRLWALHRRALGPGPGPTGGAA
jgi:GT2 family glycosyltransferase